MRKGHKPVSSLSNDISEHLYNMVRCNLYSSSLAEEVNAAVTLSEALRSGCRPSWQVFLRISSAISNFTSYALTSEIN
jgi:hypothetical protein